MKNPYLLALAGLTVAASTGFSQTPIPITDHSFETPAPGGYYGTVFAFGTKSNYVTGWTTTPNTAGGTNNGDIYSVLSEPTIPSSLTGYDGNQVVEDFAYPGGTSNAGGSIYQVEDGTAGTTANSFGIGTYTLTALAGSKNTAEVGDTFYFALSTAPTTPIAFTPITNTSSAMALTTVTLSNLAGLYSGPIVIGFQSPLQTAQSSEQIDDFTLTFTPVPEPSSIAIAALGGVGLLGAVLRRRRA